MNAVNLFAYGDGENVTALGYCHYTLDGSDQDVAAYLRSRVEIDHQRATRIRIGSPLTTAEFSSLIRLDPELLLMKAGASPDAAYCITSIINGEPTVDEVADMLTQDPPPDYLRVYLTEAGFDFTRLLHDDYLDVIKLLWGDEKYISALKLMLAMIDTLGFVEFGPVSDAFIRWLDEHCDMEQAGVTSRELWELRNSLLHMSNLASRKVDAGAVERLMPVIAGQEVDIPSRSDGTKTFHVTRFCAIVVPRGIAAWIRSYNEQPERYVRFISRYDTIVSEARLSVVTAAPEGP